ncbi:ABC-type multidrug transport system ATPase subunit/ABC-type transport system involved in multi-copper enzyme maturation permease subunit [Streptomyces ambofaciens]
MIEAVGLTKRYGDKTAVYNLSFQVRPGAVTGFLGPNGSGKSTTMRMILGLDNPTAGHVTIGGHPYRRLPNAARHVGALLDAKAVHGGRAARNHLLSLAQLSGIPARRVDEVLGVVGLQDVAKRRSKGFSLGMGQRLGIAAALLGDPQVLLFDEPVNGLDPEGIHWVRNLMKALAAEGRTVFVSSHLMSEMALTADHLIVIGRGQLMADMSVTEFISANSADFARVRTPDTDPQLREKLTSALTEAGGHVMPEQDGGLRVTGLALPRISDIAHDTDVRLWELSPHQALAGGGVHADDAGCRGLPVDRRPEGRAPAAPAARRAAADAGARTGPARLVRPAAAPAGRSALRRAAGRAGSGAGGPVRRSGGARGGAGGRAGQPVRGAAGAPGPADAPGSRRGSGAARGRLRARHRPEQARGRPMSTPQPPTQQAAPDWHAAPGSPYPTYTSPIPVVRTTLAHALASEWTKIKSVRSTMWTLGVFVLLVLGIGLLTGAVVASSDSDLAGESALSLGFFGLLLGSMCVITLGVLTTASEYGTGMIRTTMTVCPSRGRVLAAKGIVFFLVAFVVTLVSATLVGLAHVSMLEGNGAENPTGAEWLKGTVGVSLYVALLGLLSLAMGSIIRHSAGAITIMIGVLLAPLVIALFMFSESLKDVQQALFEYSIPNQMSIFYANSLSDSGPSGWDPLWIVLGVTAAAFAAAFALLEKRDV